MPALLSNDFVHISIKPVDVGKKEETNMDVGSVIIFLVAVAGLGIILFILKEGDLFKVIVSIVYAALLGLVWKIIQASLGIWGGNN